MYSSPALLSDIRADGYVALWLIIFLGGVGIPLPTDPLLLAAGALAGHGSLNALVLAVVAVTAAACGDGVGYLIGRSAGARAAAWLERSRLGQRLLPPSTLEYGRAYFVRYGGWAIFLSRWLAGIFSGAVNLLAGIRRFPFPSFLAYAVAGEALDTVIMLGLGTAFGASWMAANNVLKIVLLVICGILIAGLLIARALPSFRHATARKQRHAVR